MYNIFTINQNKFLCLTVFLYTSQDIIFKTEHELSDVQIVKLFNRWPHITCTKLHIKRPTSVPVRFSVSGNRWPSVRPFSSELLPVEVPFWLSSRASVRGKLYRRTGRIGRSTRSTSPSIAWCLFGWCGRCGGARWSCSCGPRCWQSSRLPSATVEVRWSS